MCLCLVDKSRQTTQLLQIICFSELQIVTTGMQNIEIQYYCLKLVSSLYTKHCADPHKATVQGVKQYSSCLENAFQW